MSFFAAARVLRARAERRRKEYRASEIELAQVKRAIYQLPGPFNAWLMKRLAQELDEAAAELVERANECANEDVTPGPGPRRG